jgi:hypothetical protein
VLSLSDDQRGLFSHARVTDGGFQSAVAKLDYGPDQIYQPESKDAYPDGGQTQTQNDCCFWPDRKTVVFL